MEVEDFTDLSKVSTEKLLKLRDVARDYHDDMKQAEVEAWNRLNDIENELKERMNAEKIV